jgi:GH15 family glucan-1,4-alpha-glucosidase
MPDGFMLHKYNPDGSAGSSWHPWFRDGSAQLPIQEDETALVIYAMWKHFKNVNDFEFLQEMYQTFVRNGAQFLCDFREEASGLMSSLGSALAAPLATISLVLIYFNVKNTPVTPAPETSQKM